MSDKILLANQAQARQLTPYPALSWDHQGQLRETPSVEGPGFLKRRPIVSNTMSETVIVDPQNQADDEAGSWFNPINTSATEREDSVRDSDNVEEHETQTQQYLENNKEVVQEPVTESLNVDIQPPVSNYWRGASTSRTPLTSSPALLKNKHQGFDLEQWLLYKQQEKRLIPPMTSMTLTTKQY